MHTDMQQTCDAEQVWQEDPNEFAADEDNEHENYDPRKSAITLLQVPLPLFSSLYFFFF